MANLKDLIVNGVTRFVGKAYAQTPDEGSNDTQIATTEFVMSNVATSSYKPPLFSCTWADHQLNDAQWLRGDTFSWQDGTVYETAYNTLKTEFQALTKTTLYKATGTDDSVVYLTKSTGFTVGDNIYRGTENVDIHLAGTVTAVDETTVTFNSTVYTVGSTAINTLIFERENNIYFVRTANKYKICQADQETNVYNKWVQQGIAWYYILDLDNVRFKLPRTKFGFKGLRSTVGSDITESLPNINATWVTTGQSSASGVGAVNSGTGAVQTNDSNMQPSTTAFTVTSTYGRYANQSFDASRSSTTYQDNAPVQERATQMYLYFYVGEFSQTSLQQTAGLKAELFNNKADVTLPPLQAPYLKESYVNGESGYNIWSNGYCEQWGHSSAESVTLLKVMSNTNYCISFGKGSGNQQDYSSVFYNKTVSGFGIHYSETDWKVSGYSVED